MITTLPEKGMESHYESYRIIRIKDKTTNDGSLSNFYIAMCSVSRIKFGTGCRNASALRLHPLDQSTFWSIGKIQTTHKSQTALKLSLAISLPARKTESEKRKGKKRIVARNATGQSHRIAVNQYLTAFYR